MENCSNVSKIERLYINKFNEIHLKNYELVILTISVILKYAQTFYKTVILISYCCNILNKDYY